MKELVEKLSEKLGDDCLGTIQDLNTLVKKVEGIGITMRGHARNIGEAQNAYIWQLPGYANISDNLPPVYIRTPEEITKYDYESDEGTYVEIFGNPITAYRKNLLDQIAAGYAFNIYEMEMIRVFICKCFSGELDLFIVEPYTGEAIVGGSMEWKAAAFFVDLLTNQSNHLGIKFEIEQHMSPAYDGFEGTTCATDIFRIKFTKQDDFYSKFPYTEDLLKIVRFQDGYLSDEQILQILNNGFADDELKKLVCDKNVQVSCTFNEHKFGNGEWQDGNSYGLAHKDNVPFDFEAFCNTQPIQKDENGKQKTVTMFPWNQPKGTEETPENADTLKPVIPLPWATPKEE